MDLHYHMIKGDKQLTSKSREDNKRDQKNVSAPASLKRDEEITHSC